MTTLQLPVRWYPTVTPEDVECLETNGSYLTATWPLAAEQSALVMVDCWDTHPILSHLENSGRIIREVVKPLLDTCKAAGITIVHAPSPQQAQQYPEWVRYAGDAELGYVPPAPGVSTAWPPAEFRQRTGEWEALQRPTYLRDVSGYLPDRRIVADIAPREGEFVVATGNQLHRLLQHRGILHLLYVGFATNMCVVHRDYGIIAMSQRGYDCVLLRDGTLGIEAAHTYAESRLTEATILQVEMLWGVSSTAAEVRAAIEVAG
ncbi:MAG: cysteine hydrolase family protein [Armatimonadetes bacterium]|nr:cysteine hydrolase family protein [Armatimonadota bacterium]